MVHELGDAVALGQATDRRQTLADGASEEPVQQDGQEGGDHADAHGGPEIHAPGDPGEQSQVVGAHREHVQKEHADEEPDVAELLDRVSARGLHGLAEDEAHAGHDDEDAEQTQAEAQGDLAWGRRLEGGACDHALLSGSGGESIALRSVQVSTAPGASQAAGPVSG